MNMKAIKYQKLHVCHDCSDHFMRCQPKQLRSAISAPQAAIACHQFASAHITERPVRFVAGCTADVHGVHRAVAVSPNAARQRPQHVATLHSQ